MEASHGHLRGKRHIKSKRRKEGRDIVGNKDWGKHTEDGRKKGSK